MNITDVPGDQSKLIEENDAKPFKHEQFKGGWQTVIDDAKIDLQLPNTQMKKKYDSKIDLSQPEKIEFKEKTLDDQSILGTKRKEKDLNVGFKKRKLNNANRRLKTEDD